MVEGPEQSPWAPAAPKAGQEGVDSQSEPSIVSLGFGVSRARMVAFGFVSEFSDVVKFRVEQTPALCATPEALTAPPAPDLVLVTLLAFALAREVTASFFSLSFISIFFCKFQSPIFPSMSSFRPPGPAPAFFPAYFERGVAAPAISALDVNTSVCRDSQPERIRAIMLFDPGLDLEGQARMA